MSKGLNYTVAQVAALQAFATYLRGVHREAGEPSYATMVKASNNLSAPTLSRVLNGKHNPNWNVVEGFLRACGVSAEERAECRVRWVQLRDVLAPIPGRKFAVDEANDPAPSADAGCPRCGLVIADVALHETWHTQWVPIADAGQRLHLRLVADTDTGRIQEEAG